MTRNKIYQPFKTFFMTEKQAQILTDYAGEIYENYSGRGMYGRETTGVRFESESEFYSALAEVILYEDEEERELIADMLNGLKLDRLGTGVIYY